MRRGGQHGARDVARGFGPGEPGRGRRHRGEPRRIEQDRVDLGPQPLAASARRRGSRSPRRRPASSARSRSGGRPSRADTARAPPAGRTAPARRRTRRRARPRGRPPRAPDRTDRGSRAGRSALPGLRRSPKSRRPATCSTRYGASANAATRRLVDRAGAERAAEDQHAALVRRRSRARRGPARARRRAAGPGGRSPGSARPRARRSEREADAPRARREQPVAQPEVRIGLGQHERDAPQQPPRARPDPAT